MSVQGHDIKENVIFVLAMFCIVLISIMVFSFTKKPSPQRLDGTYLVIRKWKYMCGEEIDWDGKKTVPLPVYMLEVRPLSSRTKYKIRVDWGDRWDDINPQDTVTLTGDLNDNYAFDPHVELNYEKEE